VNDVLSTREWATVAWSVVLVVVACWRPSGRKAVRGLLGSALAPRILMTFGLVAAWESLLIWLAHAVGAWNVDLLKDALAWFLVSGLGLGFAALRAMKEDLFFRQQLRAVLGATVFLQFVLNLYTFSLPIELVLQPVVALLVCVGIYVNYHPEQMPAKKLSESLLAVGGVVLLVYTVKGIVATWDTIDAKEKLLGLAFSLWLPLLMLPLIYLLALAMLFETTFSLMSLRIGGPVTLGTKAAVLVGTRGRLSFARSLRKSWTELPAIASAQGWREKLALVRTAGRS
jgi:hypothetical protein